MRVVTRLINKVLLVLLCLPCLGTAQVKIENPLQLEIPEARVQLLHRITCGVVADEFHLKASELDGPVTLVVGERKEVVGKIAPGSDAPFVVYLDHWDEGAFAVTDMQLMLYRVLSGGREKKMIGDVFRRLNQTAPVGVRALRNNAGIQMNSPSIAGDCVSAISDSSRPGCTAAQFSVAGRP
jgi:hypothetical protein